MTNKKMDAGTRERVDRAARKAGKERERKGKGGWVWHGVAWRGEGTEKE